MIAALRYAHLLALAVWIGSVVFLSFVAAPALFGALPREMAGRATAAIFPPYHALGAACGLVAILTALLAAARAGAWTRPLAIEIGMLVLMTGLTLCNRQTILPRAQAARAALAGPAGSPEPEAARARFAALHRISVALNGAVLLLGLGTLAIASVRPPGSPHP
jgi:putative copper export protein